jgi:excisionase family DNA binding protein
LAGGRRGKSGTRESIPLSPPNPETVFNKGVGKRLLNVVEAAEYLGLAIDTLYKKARLRELPTVKVGRALRFDVETLKLYIAQHAIETID